MAVVPSTSASSLFSRSRIQTESSTKPFNTFQRGTLSANYLEGGLAFAVVGILTLLKWLTGWPA
jgi:hypothetical protein